MQNWASRVVVLLSAIVLAAGCGGGGGQRAGAGGAGVGGAGSGGAAGGSSGQSCTVSNTTGSCSCRDEANATPPVRCDTASVATLSGEVGLCCQGFSCQCDAFICRNDLATGGCFCGMASSIVSVAHGATVSICLPTPVTVGTTVIPARCCLSEDLRDCTCSTLACDNGRVEVASCSLAQVMSCFTGAHPVASCSGGPITGTGGAAGSGGATGDAGVDGPFDTGARGGAPGDARDSRGDLAVDAGDGPATPPHALRWVRSAVVAADVTPYADGEDVAVLAGGDILVLLQYASRITLGQGEPSETTLTTSNGNEGVLARYRSDGTFIQAIVIPGFGFRPGHVVATADGGFVVTGAFLNSVTLGLGETHETTFVVADAQGFVARYGANGALAWARPLPVSPNAVLELATGAVVVAGSFSFDFTFGAGTPNATSLTPFSQMGGMPYSSDLYAASYDKDGTFAWIVTGGSPNPMYTSNDGASGIAALGSNQIAVVATFNPLLTLQPGRADARQIASSSVQDLLVVRVAADSGAIAGVTTLSATGGVYQPRIAALGGGSYALAGQNVGAMALGAGTPNQRQLDGNGFFLARFGADDAFVRVDSIVELDDISRLYFGTLLGTPSGGVLLHAYFGGSLAFSPGRPEAQTIIGGSYLLARYAAGGPLETVTVTPGGTMSGGAALAADGAPVLTGTIAGTAMFDTPTPSVFVVPDRTMFVARGNP